LSEEKNHVNHVDPVKTKNKGKNEKFSGFAIYKPLPRYIKIVLSFRPGIWFND